MEKEQNLNKSLDLLLRLPPQFILKFLKNVIKLRPDLQDDLLYAVDLPLETGYDNYSKNFFLISTFNQDGYAHRSPWSNCYFPPISDGLKPSSQLREMEIAANDAFKKYVEMYFEDATHSVYVWGLDDGFAFAVLIKKEGDGSSKVKGKWDSVHVVQVTENLDQATYKVTSTITLWLHTRTNSSGVMNISGSITRQHEKSYKMIKGHRNFHIINVGELVEEMENNMRHSLYEIYFWKTKDVTTRYLRYCIKNASDQRRLSRMLDFKLERSKSTVHRSPSGKHVLVPMQNSFKV